MMGGCHYSLGPKVEVNFLLTSNNRFKSQNLLDLSAWAERRRGKQVSGSEKEDIKSWKLSPLLTSSWVKLWMGPLIETFSTRPLLLSWSLPAARSLVRMYLSFRLSESMSVPFRFCSVILDEDPAKKNTEHSVSPQFYFMSLYLLFKPFVILFVFCLFILLLLFWMRFFSEWSFYYLSDLYSK